MSRRRIALFLSALTLASIGGVAESRAQTGGGQQSGGVLVVGDSLEVLTSPYLRRYLPGVPLTINVKGGYSSIQIFRLFQQAYDPSQSVIVFDAGTNDNPSYPQILAARLQAVAATVGDRCMVVPTIHGLTVNGVNSAGKNRVVSAFAASRPGTQVPDWAGFVAAHPEFMQPDNLHPNTRGADLRARLIAEGVQACLRGDVFAPLQSPAAGGPAPEPRKQPPRRPRKPPAKKRPPPPPPKFEEEGPVLLDEPVKFTSGGASLSGEFITPAAEGRHPAVVMLHGSGAVTREDYREQAEFLAEHGVGALIYDKRGSGESTGSSDYRLSQLAEDGRAAVALLTKRAEVDPSGIGLWGVSEGGAVAPLVAAGNRDVAAVMVVSPVVLAPASQEEWAVRRNLHASGAGAGDAAVSTFYAVAADAGGLASNRAADLSFQAAPVWRKVAQPVLGVWGSDDRLVPPRASASALAAALADGENLDRSFRVFRGAAHNLGVQAEAFRPGSAPGFKELSADWLRAHLGDGKRPKPRVAVSLPPLDAVPVRALAEPSLLDRWPVQLAWLLLPAAGLAVVVARGLLRRRRDEAAPALSTRTWLWLGGVVTLDLLALFALAYAVVSIVEVDGRGISAVAGTPVAIGVTWLFTGLATLATAWLARRVVVAGGGFGAVRRNPSAIVALASFAWLLLLVYWLA
ncbi:MAG: uncharacterized protein QOH76_570 [Thermoleophilaceae bacterium]|nr:uncharacterized protein [Thermoleophilaceae bacterium]